jgi:hypothetical protein
MYGMEDEDSSQYTTADLKVIVGRLAAVQGRALLGATGEISVERLQRLKTH